MMSSIFSKNRSRFAPLFIGALFLVTLGSLVLPLDRSLAQTAPDISPDTSPGVSPEVSPEVAPEAAPTEVEPTEVEPTAPSGPIRCRRRLVGNQCLRLRATFFEEERRLRQFRNVDFLEAALDGAGNTINTGSRDPDLINAQSITEAFPGDVVDLPIDVDITNRDPDSSGFLRGSTFTDTDTDTSLTISNVQRDSASQQRGVLSIRGTIRGQRINIVNGSYRASGTQNGDLVGGVIVITDPANPRRDLQIVFPSQDVGEVDDDEPISGFGRLSIGRGVDR